MVRGRKIDEAGRDSYTSKEGKAPSDFYPAPLREHLLNVAGIPGLDGAFKVCTIYDDRLQQ
jgi:hypothetical protein